MKLSLIIPAYNEEERIGKFLADVAIFSQNNPNLWEEFLVVDDGSKDNTVAAANKFASSVPGLRVISLAENVGKGGAIAAGVKAATGDAIVFMDADGATPISELPKMIEALGEADIAVGNRWMKDSDTDRSSFLRHIAGWTYRNYMGLFGLRDVDTMCGFKGYRREVARDLFSNLLENRWLFDTEIAYKARRKGYKVKNFPIKWASVDGSKLPTSTLIKSAFEIWPLIARIKKQKNA